MQTLVMYNNVGKVIMTVSGGEQYTGAALAVTDVPDGYYIESVNPETGEPVLAKIPLTEEQQRLANLESQIDALAKTQDFQEDCIAEMAGIVYAE